MQVLQIINQPGPLPLKAQFNAPLDGPALLVVPDGAHIGLDLEADRQRYHVSEGGIAVLGKSQLALPT